MIYRIVSPSQLIDVRVNNVVNQNDGFYHFSWSIGWHEVESKVHYEDVYYQKMVDDEIFLYCKNIKLKNLGMDNPWGCVFILAIDKNGIIYKINISIYGCFTVYDQILNWIECYLNKDFGVKQTEIDYIMYRFMTDDWKILKAHDGIWYVVNDNQIKENSYAV